MNQYTTVFISSLQPKIRMSKMAIQPKRPISKKISENISVHGAHDSLPTIVPGQRSNGEILEDDAEDEGKYRI